MARVAVLLVALLLAGCAQASGGTATSEDVVGEWQLVSGTASGTALALPEGAAATLVLDGTHAGGTSFCNHYGGEYVIDGGSIALANLGGTEMACEPAVMAAEEQFLQALRSVDTVARDDGHLVLTGEDVELRFEPVPAVPRSALVETDWVLETVLDGDLASTPVGEPARLRLSEDGTLTGSTGCRSLYGTWKVFGGSVVFPDLGAEGECPDDLLAQDGHVLTVLGDGFRAGIDGDLLTALDADGSGLVYRAER